MCTVSWLIDGTSCTILFNRDELKSRARALPPTLRSKDGVAMIAPADPDGKGTWIGANTKGFACCILNNYRAGAAAPTAKISRGLIAESLLACESQRIALDTLHRHALNAYRPFHLLLFEEGRRPLLCDWNGSELQYSTPVAPFTSSSFKTQAVIEERIRNFPADPDEPTLRSFHASHLPDRSAYSVCMHRLDAETVSFSRIHITPAAVDFMYLPAAPCLRADVPVYGVRVQR